MQVGEDPGAVGEGVAGIALRAAPACEACIEGVEPPGHSLEGLALRSLARGCLLALPERVVLGEAGCGGRGELGLEVDADGRGDRAAGRPCLEQEPRRAVERRDEDRRVLPSTAARAAPSRAVRAATRPARSRGIAGRATSGVVRRSTASQPGSSRSAWSAAAHAGALVGRSSATMRFRLRAGRMNSSSETPGETSS